MRNRTELDWATNMYGKLTDDLKQLIYNYLDNPNVENWNGCYNIIINGHGMGRTVFQAVCIVDNSFAHAGYLVSQNGEIVETWDKIPNTRLVKEAIYFATH